MSRRISIRAFLRARLAKAAPLAAGLLLFAAPGAHAQERRSRVDVDLVVIDAEISPTAQTLSAKAAIRLTPLDEGTTSATFDLNNALNVSRVVDEKGAQIPASRDQQDSTIRLSFEPALTKGQPVTVTFYYDGKLTGQEESPVYGVKFAAIHPDFAYLMYPARWFPVAGYTTDRFAADFRITVPNGYSAIASGFDAAPTSANGKITTEFKFDNRSFPGSIAVVQGNPVRVQSEGSTSSIYFRGPEADMAQTYGDETGKQMSWFTATFGLPPTANLKLIETEDGAPNGYAAPGLIFLSPKGIGTRLNARALANQVSRQWWEELVSGVTRNHIWLTNGLAAYSELLWLEQESGKAAMQTALHDVMLEALTVDDVPIIQSARLEDYSPELWALSGSKGAAVCNMLRNVVGDAKFQAGLQAYVKNNVWKAVSTDDFRKAMEAASGQDLGYFFSQWIESSLAPEFKLEYTVFRVGTKGYRVMGKVTQDMDTFRMPVAMKIVTEGDPEQQTVLVEGSSSEFSIDTFGKPKDVLIDPDDQVLHYSPDIRVGVAIRRGEQFAEIGEYTEALKEYNKALDTNRMSSLAHYRKAEIYFMQATWQSAANEFHEVLNGDLEPKWTEVWAHINLGKIYDISGQRDRAVSEYNQAARTKDDTQGAQAEAQKYIKTPYAKQQTAEKQ
ncbi:MAG TPA: M1 family aminopeptidase [Bryobacteraceae bacterium]|nr:M1 family aminopeptidase [Bryobacteraceae bacterium]